MRRRRPHCTADPEVAVLVLGMMSGTSVDAIDAAIVRIEETGDELTVELIAYHEQPHDDALRRRVHTLFDPAASRTDE